MPRLMFNALLWRLRNISGEGAGLLQLDYWALSMHQTEEKTQTQVSLSEAN